MGTLDGDRPQTLRVGAQLELEYGKLTKKEIDAIRQKARQKVELELKDAEEDRLLKQFMKEERAKHDPAQEEFEILVSLAPSQPWIMLDGTQYLADRKYKVPLGVFQVLLEQINRGWAHEEVTQVRSENGQPIGRRPHHIGIGNFSGSRTPRELSMSAATLAGASPAQLLGIGA